MDQYGPTSGSLFLLPGDVQPSVALGRPVRRPSSKPKSDSSISSLSSATNLLELMNSSVLDSISTKVSSATGGRLDVRLFIAACVGAKAAASSVPSVIEMVFDQVKTNVSSSLVVSQNDPVLYKGLQYLAQDKAEASGKAWYNFSGQHGVQLANGDIGNLPGKSQKFFRHDGTLFILEVDEHDAPLHPRQLPTSRMVVRCFGHSNAPIRALFDYVIEQHRESQELTVLKMVAGANEPERSTCNKRHLSTIDLDPILKEYITRDAELFFGEDSPDFYESTGQPYRRGYLLYGPPGTGKTSVSKAIASHFNLPLVLITLKGMSDKDLMDAFARLPYRCVVLLEDIDCAGADVDNRDAQPATGSGKGKEKAKSISEYGEAEAVKKSILKTVKKQVDHDHQEMLEDMEDFKDFISGQMGLQPPKQKRTKTSRAVDPNQKVSLSGLLNVIDGADAAEGRLLIMTTNCPEKLDKALLRPGRCDEKFKIDYATKITAQLTFKRIFGLDEQTPYKPATIDRFAQAFVAQFPSNSRISTAELAKYLGQYRGRPQKAIEDFAEWTKRGIDLFSYRVDELASNLADGEYNVPEAYELSLLNVGPEDMVDVKVKSKSKSNSKGEKPIQSSSWNPFRWWRTAQPDDNTSLALELADLLNKPANDPSFLQGFIKDQAKMDAPAGPGFDQFRQPFRQAQAISFYQGLGLITPNDGAPRKQYKEFGDEAFELDALETELRAVSPRPIQDSSPASPATSEHAPTSPQASSVDSSDTPQASSPEVSSEDSSQSSDDSSEVSPTSSKFFSDEFHSAEDSS